MSASDEQVSAGSPAARRRKLLARALGASVALAFGAWISLQFWPHWQEYQERVPPKPDAPAVIAPAFAPPLAPDKETSVLGTDASVSEKALQLVLVSTAPAASLQDSTATLGTDPRNPQTYSGGAILANGARIEEIHSDRIVLARNGFRETLVADGDAASRVSRIAAVNEQRAAKGYEILTPTLAEGRPGSVSSIGGGGDSGRQSSVATSREDLSEFIRPQAVYENEKFAGLKILPGTNGSRLASLGMEAGDVIRSVEGKLIESDSAWQEIDDVLSSGGSIVVGIERNGSVISVSLDGTRLAADQPIG